MNIGIENRTAKEPVLKTNRDTITQGTPSQPQKTEKKTAIALDISGTVMDNTAYEGHGKTTEDVMLEADLKDPALIKNYLAVMSNSMSDEDFAKLQDEGVSPGSTPIETVVTIVDQIKAAIVKGGADISGYTDTLDQEVLKAITGNEAVAKQMVQEMKKQDVPLTKENMEEASKAMDQMADVKELDEGTIRYMLTNEKEPTIENLYKAKHSSGVDTRKHTSGFYRDQSTGYYAKKEADIQLDQLKPQMEEVIKEAGLPVNDQTLSDAGWLINKGIPLTEDALIRLNDLRQIKLPADTPELAASIAAALVTGKNASAASLVDTRSDIQKAEDFISDLKGIGSEAVDLLSEDGHKINLRALKAAQIRLGAGAEAAPEQIKEHSANRLLLEEIRLKMTVEAGIRLQRSGINLETAELKELVDALTIVKEQEGKALFGEEGIGKKTALFEETAEKLRELPTLPAVVLGKFVRPGAVGEPIRIDALYEEGKALQNVFLKAGETYEALMTAPRSDMGDTIKKAFRSVDPLLNEMGMELTEENQRAVRILSYNNMDVTKEQVLAVKEADLSVKTAVESMKPGMVIKMIREGVNPLQMTLDEIQDFCSGEEATVEKGADKYSEYLYRLDQKGELTPEERNSYIGIYRLFRQLDKTDGAAIGALMDAGAEITLNNLLTAIRTSKKQGIDIKADDQFAGTQGHYRTESISDQILGAFQSEKKSNPAERETEKSYYKKLGKDIFRNLDAIKLDQIPEHQEMNLEELARRLREQEESAVDSSRLSEQAEQMRNTAQGDEEVVRMLMDFDQPITMDYLQAAGQLMRNRGKMAGQLTEIAEHLDQKQQWQEEITKLQDSLTGEAETQEAYGNFAKAAEELAEGAMDGIEEITAVDLNRLKDLGKQIHLSAKLSGEGNYEIPVTIHGETTSVNLRILHGTEEAGKVTITMDTKAYGKVAACFQAAEAGEQNRISGYLICNSQEGIAQLTEKREYLESSIAALSLDLTDFRLIQSERLELTSFETKRTASATEKPELEKGHEDQAEGLSNRLYQVAKAVIGFIQ